MLTFSTIIAFMVVVLGLFIIPGPAVLLVATRTIKSGRKEGIKAGLGIATGDLIHTLFAAVGLSAILMTSAIAFNLVKFAGAAYLIYLGIRAILEKSTEGQLKETNQLSTGYTYSQAIIIELLNPKTALFFLSFLPQFVEPVNGTVFVQFLVLGLIFSILSILYTTFLAMSVQLFLKNAHQATWISRWGGKIIGSIYIGLGLKVAFQKQ
ncbi:Threonine/homoserine/homoserine lactone efflux protein [Seinonella peptonophila]|uniref:Threonine/homoserine/homoserine lactone efflux protein n=1 Tax=Seinonella peptonophila TaxID=112248 RepID=A0A1M5ABR2_9BACL|nr:LysE family translocator [Seinonella peptonophila]SHF27738.1 Threonine/homoserine/homoserine lactone efflux protein [Seinonella peptonophila]